MHLDESEVVAATTTTCCSCWPPAGLQKSTARRAAAEPRFKLNRELVARLALASLTGADQSSPTTCRPRRVAAAKGAATITAPKKSKKTPFGGNDTDEQVEEENVAVVAAVVGQKIENDIQIDEEKERNDEEKDELNKLPCSVLCVESKSDSKSISSPQKLKGDETKEEEEANTEIEFKKKKKIRCEHGECGKRVAPRFGKEASERFKGRVGNCVYPTCSPNFHHQAHRNHFAAAADDVIAREPGEQVVVARNGDLMIESRSIASSWMVANNALARQRPPVLTTPVLAATTRTATATTSCRTLDNQSSILGSFHSASLGDAKSRQAGSGGGDDKTSSVQRRIYDDDDEATFAPIDSQVTGCSGHKASGFKRRCSPLSRVRLISRSNKCSDLPIERNIETSTPTPTLPSSTATQTFNSSNSRLTSTSKNKSKNRNRNSNRYSNSNSNIRPIEQEATLASRPDASSRRKIWKINKKSIGINPEPLTVIRIQEEKSALESVGVCVVASPIASHFSRGQLVHLNQKELNSSAEALSLSLQLSFPSETTNVEEKGSRKSRETRRNLISNSGAEFGPSTSVATEATLPAATSKPPTTRNETGEPTASARKTTNDHRKSANNTKITTTPATNPCDSLLGGQREREIKQPNACPRDGNRDQDVCGTRRQRRDTTERTGHRHLREPKTRQRLVVVVKSSSSGSSGVSKRGETSYTDDKKNTTTKGEKEKETTTTSTGLQIWASKAGQSRATGRLIWRFLMALILAFLVASSALSPLFPATPTGWLAGRGSTRHSSLLVSAQSSGSPPSEPTPIKSDELSRAVLATMSTQSSIDLGLNQSASSTFTTKTSGSKEATTAATNLVTTETKTASKSTTKLTKLQRSTNQDSDFGSSSSSDSSSLDQDSFNLATEPSMMNSNLASDLDSGDPSLVVAGGATPNQLTALTSLRNTNGNGNNNQNNNSSSQLPASIPQAIDSIATSGGYTFGDQLLDFGRIFIMGAIIVGDICGNSLVILSVCRHSKLRVTTNWFVVSLACADILVALFAMTFNASVIISGRWLFASWMCDFWNSCDVLASTASILHLCCISIDRYIAIMRPLDYPMKITTRRVMYTLCGVWISSALLSYIPIFTGIYTTAEHIKWLEENPDQCEFVVNRVYAVVSSAISFWIPCCIMVFTYYRIYREATRQEKFIYKAQSIMPAPMPNHHHNNHKSGGGGGASANRSKQRRSKSMAVGGSGGGGQPTGGISKEDRIRQLAKQQQEMQAPPPPHQPAPRPLPAHLGPQAALTQSSGEIATTNLTTTGGGAGETDPLNATVDVNNNNNNNNNNANANHSGNVLLVNKNQPPPVCVTQAPPLQDEDDDQNSDSGQSTPTKRSISKMKREHKAAKTLGIIMGVFVLCWLPFFLWYTPQNICGHACDGMVPKSVVTLLFWIGYFNSMLNPIIYAYFNHEFRDAFKKTLQWIFCCCEDLKCLRVQRPNDNQRYNCTYRSTQEIGLVNS